MTAEALNDAPATGTPNPSVPLPPAALRLTTLDFDPNGNPYYKFPPFVSPPDGVTLIPYKKFKPHGIQITLDSDEEELDGEGIPTVELGAKHNITDEKEKEKKKRKKKSGNELEEPKKFSPWWEDWAEGEDLRRADIYDPNTPRADRFYHGAVDFAPNRKWSPQIRNLYDCFRYYVGLLNQPSKSARRYGKADDGDEADDEDDDEAELKAEEEQPAQTNPFPEPLIDVDAEVDQPKIHEVDEDMQRKLEEDLEAKELRMDSFLNDPEKGMKIFFSSHYKDKGLFWSESKLRDGPRLLSFFLQFFIRNRIMPDYEKELRKACKVADLALLELPQTTKISMAIPDAFGVACTALWGSKQPQAWAGMNAMDVDEAGGAPPTVPQPEPVPDRVKEWEAHLKESGAEKVEINIDVNPAEPEVSGWGASHAMEGVQEASGAWGDGATVMQSASNPWAAPQVEDDWGSSSDTPALLSILGPTTIPLTHVVQLAEKSTRQIVSFVSPTPDAKGLESMLGTMVLAPWKTSKEGSTILRPELLTDLPEGITFDPSKDLIKVFVDSKAVEALREGMGLSAIFVKVVEDVKEVQDRKKPKSRGKGKGKGKGKEDNEWWYVEFLYEVLPSFWTEEND